MKPTKNCRNQRQSGKRQHQNSTNKVVDRLAYSPNKQKHKSAKAMRNRIQDKVIPPPKPTIAPTALKFGSFNVNGLDLEAGWAVQQLLSKRGYDVSNHFKSVNEVQP